MGINRYRNQPCECGSGMKFKHCHGRKLQEEQAEVVTQFAKKEQAKRARYCKKRFDDMLCEQATR